MRPRILFSYSRVVGSRVPRDRRKQRRTEREKMTRQQIIDTIGATFLVTNLETGEYSYPKALKSVGKNYKKFLVGHPDKEHKFADIKFESDKLVVLVETKDKLTKKNVADGMEQLQQYVTYESELPNVKKKASSFRTAGVRRKS